MNEEPVKEKSQSRSWVRTVGLFLAFLPSALMLALMKNQMSENYLGAICIFSLVCCFASSFMLFRRGTPWSIVCGVMFLLLNLAISFFLGCVSMLKF